VDRTQTERAINARRKTESKRFQMKKKENSYERHSEHSRSSASCCSIARWDSVSMYWVTCTLWYSLVTFQLNLLTTSVGRLNKTTIFASKQFSKLYAYTWRLWKPINTEQNTAHIHTLEMFRCAFCKVSVIEMGSVTHCILHSHTERALVTSA
jgi:hypothetical protein